MRISLAKVLIPNSSDAAIRRYSPSKRQHDRRRLPASAEPGAAVPLLPPSAPVDRPPSDDTCLAGVMAFTDQGMRNARLTFSALTGGTFVAAHPTVARERKEARLTEIVTELACSAEQTALE